MIPLVDHIRKSNAWMTRYVDSQWRRMRGDNEYLANEPTELSEGTIVPDQWYAVLESGKLGDASVGVRRLGESLVLWRDESGHAVAAKDRCPHRGSKLSLGSVSDGVIECPYHGFCFDGHGACTLIPANMPDRRIPKRMRLSTFPVREEHGLVWVWWGQERSSYPEVPWFLQSDEDEANSASKSGSWKFHYSRVIENSLDAHHFPFIHGSINPNCGKYVSPFDARLEDGVIQVTAGLKRQPTDSDDEATVFSMKLKYPSTMHVQLSPNIHLMQLATPIDDETTWMYVRYYQGFVRLPLLGPAFSKALLTFDWKIAQEMQDIPIFQTQQPKVPGSGAGYQLVEADRGIMLYLKERDRLIDQARAPETRRTTGHFAVVRNPA